jgi:chromosome segregation ATPase
LTGKIAPEEEFVRGVNPEFLSSKVGLSGRTADPRFTDLEVAKYRQDTFNRYNQRISETENQINQLSNQIRESQNRLQQAQADLDASTDEGEDRTRKEEQVRQIARRESDNINRFQNQLNNAVFDNTTLKQGLSKMDLSLQPKLQEYESNLNKTRQEILSQYDPNRLSRIQALQQLAGTTQFDPLLQTRLT